MSSDEDINRIEELIGIVKRRKHVLDKTAAIEGIHTSPGIVLHQQEAETEIQKLDNQRQELLAAIVMPEITRRRDAWAQSVANGIVALTDKGLSTENLAQNEEFTTAFLHASQVALRSHQKEKLTALRNAVLNVAANSTLEDYNLLLFFTYIDTLTYLHIRVLHFLSKPHKLKLRWKLKIGDEGRYNDHGYDRYMVILGDLFPETKGEYETIVKIIIRDLVYNKLMYQRHSGRFVVTEDGVKGDFLTLLGRQFLSFITSPIDDDPDTPTTP